MRKKAVYYIIFALIILNMYTLSALNKLERNMNNSLQHNEFSISTLRSEMNNINSNVDEKLKKQASILDKHQVILGELNPYNFTIPVRVIITPKEISQGLTASLLLVDKNIPMVKEGTTFIAQADVSVFENFQPRVVLEQNGVKKLETLEEYNYDLREKYLLGIHRGFAGTSSYGAGEYECNGEIMLQFSSSEANKPVEVSIVKAVNGAAIEEKNIEASNFNGPIAFKESIKLAPGDGLEIYVKVKDSYGLSYKYEIIVFKSDSQGQPVENIKSMEGQQIVEIRDITGKVVYALEKDLKK